MFIASFKPWK